MDFALSRVRAPGRSFQSTLEGLTANGCAALKPATKWGAFFGLFGLHSSEFILVTTGDVDDIESRLTARADVVSASTLLLEPTVRPTTADPVSREGLYVFRYFDVAHNNVDEIAALSKEAWETFEESSEYDAQPQALFCERQSTSDHGQMLLVTWYSGLDSWQTSRKPHPDATANFRKRQALTEGTVAYATRLLP